MMYGGGQGGYGLYSSYFDPLYDHCTLTEKNGYCCSFSVDENTQAVCCNLPDEGMKCATIPFRQ